MERIPDGYVKITGSTKKMGAIPSVSLPPIETCRPGTPCASGGCYGVRLAKLRPQLRAALCENLRIYREFPGDYFRQVRVFLAATRRKVGEPLFFRWHVFGDFPDQRYLEMVFETAKLTPWVKHLAFTKRWDLNLDPAAKPDNLEIVISRWPGDKADHLLKEKGWSYRNAWVQDGQEARVPANALVCPGTCINCAMCWHLSEIGRDVWFRKRT